MLWRKNSLYDLVYRDENLNNAWRNVRVKSKISGIDGVTVDRFQANLFTNLKQLQNELMKKRYDSKAIKRFTCQKPDGSKRPLGILTVRDRIVQRAVYQVIEPIFDISFEEFSYGFRRNRSVNMAVNYLKHIVNKGNYWILNLDIECFFDNIDTGQLYTLITKRVNCRTMRKMIMSWFEREAGFPKRDSFFAAKKMKGILQGGILSPLYGNIYLDCFDKESAQLGLDTVRFADNILVATRSKSDAENVLGKVKDILQKLNLQLNETKTELTHLEEGITFLGKRLTLFNYGKNVSLSVKDKVVTPVQRDVLNLRGSDNIDNEAVVIA